MSPLLQTEKRVKAACDLDGTWRNCPGQGESASGRMTYDVDKNENTIVMSTTAVTFTKTCKFSFGTACCEHGTGAQTMNTE